MSLIDCTPATYYSWIYFEICKHQADNGKFWKDFRTRQKKGYSDNNIKKIKLL